MKDKFISILKWSEKYTKTDMLYLAKGGSWLAFGQVFAIVFGLSLSIAFANLVPKEVFGNYKFIISAAGIIGAFSLTGMGHAVTRAVAKGFEGSLRQGFKAQLRWNILTAGISMCASLYYFINGNLPIAISFFIVGLALPFSASSNLYGPYLTGKKEFKTSAYYGLIRNAVPPFVLVSLLFFSENIVYIILLYYASTTLPSLFFYFRTLKKYKPNNNTDKDTVPYSKHLSSMNLLSAASNQLDNILIFHFLGAAGLAVYAFATAMPTQMKSVSKILSTLLLPKLSEKNIYTLKKTILHKVLVAFILGFLLFMFYVLVAPFVYHLLFPQYIESIFYSQIIAVTLIFLPVTIFDQLLVSQNKKKEMYIIRTLVPITRIVLLFALLPMYGIMGAIVATIGAYVVSLISNLIAFQNLSTEEQAE